jgi:PST family polysaccharide transporter
MNSILNKIKLYNKILKNLTYLGVLQVFNLFLPLISYPYLLSTIGTEKYGLIIYSSVIISYFIVLINFGFNISATKNISIYRNDKNKISEIVSSTLVIKGLIFLLSFFIFLPLLIFIPDFNDYFLLYIITYIACLYEAFFPFWYFQGIEEMKYITYINVITRGVFTILIFILVNSSEDYLIVPTLNAFGYLIACLISLYIVFIKNKVDFFLPKKNILKFY